MLRPTSGAGGLNQQLQSIVDDGFTAAICATEKFKVHIGLYHFFACKFDPSLEPIYVQRFCILNIIFVFEVSRNHGDHRNIAWLPHGNAQYAHEPVAVCLDSSLEQTRILT